MTIIEGEFFITKQLIRVAWPVLKTGIFKQKYCFNINALANIKDGS